jgi:hypothetical protein
LQLFEGGTDSSHVGILHCNLANPGWKTKPDHVPETSDYTSVALAVDDNAPDLDIENTEYGYHYAAKRSGPRAADGGATSSVRVTAVIFPVCRIIPLTRYQFFVFEVPQDDVRTSTYVIAHGPQSFDRKKMFGVLGLDNDRLWNEKDCEYRVSEENLFGQDRSKMDVACSCRKTPASVCRWGRLSSATRKCWSRPTQQWFGCDIASSSRSAAMRPDRIRSGSILGTIRRCVVSPILMCLQTSGGRTSCPTTCRWQRRSANSRPPDQATPQRRC